MNNGAFGENFPYNNFHDLNMDWIIKIVKDFLDQYTHIQEIIDNGEQSLLNLTAEGLEQLQTKADALETLLQQWYDTHSVDIANQLTNALADLASAENTAITDFTQQAIQRANEAIESIPEDYTAFYTSFENLYNQYIAFRNDMLWNDYLTLGLKMTDGHISSSTGEIVENATYEYSQLIRVFPNMVFSYVSHGGGSTLAIACYATASSPTADTTKSVVGQADGNARGFRVPEGITYIRFSRPKLFSAQDYISTTESIYVHKDGKQEVKAVNLEGFYQEGNLNDKVTLINTGKYITTTNPSDTTMVLAGATPAYKLYEIAIPSEIDQIILYFPNRTIDMRIVFLASDKTTYVYPPIHQAYNHYAILDTHNAPYIYYNFPDDPIEGVSSGSIYSPTKYYNVPDWMQQVVEDANKLIIAPVETVNVIGDNSEELSIPAVKNGVKKGIFITSEAFFSTFTNMTMGFRNDITSRIAIRVDANNILVFGDLITYYNVAHGMTISTYLKIKAELTDTGTLKCTLYTKDDSFTFETTPFYYDFMYPFVNATNTDSNYTKLSWICPDVDKKYWFFGDSYFSFTDDRWMHYYEYKDNILIQGVPGENSNNATENLEFLLQYGKPEYIIWCTGMNDGSDNNAPSTIWMNGLNRAKSICEQYGIKLILSTIPTVPSINHEFKNNYVRTSGYRYIDFARAVGASSTGSWYTGMLSNDNVHPTSVGAKALASQVYVDFPEADQN